MLRSHSPEANPTTSGVHSAYVPVVKIDPGAQETTDLAYEIDLVSATSGCRGCGPCCCRCCPEPYIIGREPIFCGCGLGDLLAECHPKGCRWEIPFGAGAWHWFHQDLTSADNGGYGIDGLRGTYFWYVTADPRIDLCNGRSIGGHCEIRLRERDLFRSFIPGQVWPYQAYGYISDPEWGTLKAGQIWKRFGMDWDGVFWGNAPYFDGTKLDPDFGLSWERTTEVDDCFSIAQFYQFYFHEDNVNGSFGGADPESVPGYTERITGVVRVVPTWVLCNGAKFELGFSGLVGQIDSRRVDLDDQVVAAYAVDANYYYGRWRLFAEGQQTFGIVNPVRYVSGGPSNRVTNLLAGVHYTTGPVTWRGSYSCSIDANPNGMQNLLVTGATITLTDHVDLYVEYVNQQISGNANPALDGHVFNSMEFILNWHF